MSVEDLDHCLRVCAGWEATERDLLLQKTVFVETVVVSKAVFAMEINFQKRMLEVPLEVLCWYATFQPLKI